MEPPCCVLTCSTGGDGVLWDVRTRTVVGRYTGMTVTPRTLVSARRGPRVEDAILYAALKGKPSVAAWRWAADAPVATSHLAGMMDCLAVSSDGVWAAAGSSDGRVWLWNTVSGALLRTWECHYKGVTAVAWSPCTTMLITGGGDGLVHAWNTATVTNESYTGHIAPCASASSHALPITCLAFTPHTAAMSALLLSSSLDGTLRVWRVCRPATSVGTLVPEMVAGAATSLATSAALVMEAVVDVQAPITTFCTWATDTQPVVVAAAVLDGRILHLSHPLTPTHPSSSPPSPFASTSTSGVGVQGPWASWSEWCGHVGSVNALAVVPGGAMVVSAGADGVARVWDVASGKQVSAYVDHHNPVTNVMVVMAEEGVALQGRGHGPRSATTAAATVSSSSVPAPPRSACHVPPHTTPAAVAARARPPPIWRKHLIRPAPDAPLPPDTFLLRRTGADVDVMVHRRRATAHAVALLSALATMPALSATTATKPTLPLATTAAGTDASTQAAALTARIAALEAENARWKDVNNRLVAKLQGLAAVTMQAAAPGPTVGDKRPREGDAKA